MPDILDCGKCGTRTKTLACGECFDRMRAERDALKTEAETTEAEVQNLLHVNQKLESSAEAAERALEKADLLSIWARTHKGQTLGHVGEDELGLRALAYDEARAATRQTTEGETDDG